MIDVIVDESADGQIPPDPATNKIDLFLYTVQEICVDEKLASVVP